MNTTNTINRVLNFVFCGSFLVVLAAAIFAGRDKLTNAIMSGDTVRVAQNFGLGSHDTQVSVVAIVFVVVLACVVFLWSFGERR